MSLGKKLVIKSKTEKVREEVKKMSYQYIKPTDEQKKIMQHYRDEYTKLAYELNKLSSSRGMSLALTKLEESAFWLNKSITKND